MSALKTVAIIQARMSSSRLPGKVLLDIDGQSMLKRVIGRARRATSLDVIAIATTTDTSDDLLANYCQENGYPCFRGSLYDVLDRYYQAALAFQAQVIVRLTADCPVIDLQVIDQTVNAFFGGSREQPAFDFAANRLPPPWKRTFPIGLDTEVCSFQALERAWKEAKEPYQREHVMPYLYAEQNSRHFYSLDELRKAEPLPAGQFKVRLVEHDPDYGQLRWTVDTPEDLELVRQIYAHFHGREYFSWLEVLDLVQHQPELAQINAGVRHKSVEEVDERQNKSHLAGEK